jgi:hypothetical protein
VRLSHVADAWLEADEVVTFRTDSGCEFDVTRKSWGFYAVPSLNGRLPKHGLRPALVSDGETLYLLLCERDREAEFASYLDDQGLSLKEWLDSR